MNQHERYKQAKRITLFGALVNALLAMLKLAGGIVYHSHALVADGVHSLSDLLIDLMVLVAAKYSHQDADLSHPYGHQRIETAATLILALILIFAGASIIVDAFGEILRQEQDHPGMLTLPIALFSIVANEGLFHYTHAVGQRIQSELIIANAWHHRSDAASSIVVFLGLSGSAMGWPYFDRGAAIIVGMFIIKMGWDYGWNSIKELVDTAVEPNLLNTIETVIQKVPGAEKIHQLRSRSMGKDIFVDVHIQVAPFISVSEGHFIAQRVQQALLDNIPRMKDVTVHIDPEDDEMECPSLKLPNRQVLFESFLGNWQRRFPGIKTWSLHYLEGKLTIDLLCEANFDEQKKLYQQVLQDLKRYPNIHAVRLFVEGQVIMLAKSGD